MMKVLIVGGAGYVGGWLTDYLLALQYDVTVYDVLAYEERYLKEVTFIRGDVRDTEKLEKILPKYDCVIWLAAVVGDGACAADRFTAKAINEDATKWLVDHYDGRIVFPSTCSVYGVNNDLIDETATPNPLSVYAVTKLAAEQYILKNRPDSLVFRLGTLYGLGDEHSRIRLDLVVNVLAKKAALGETLRVNGGEQWRPLLHVRDVCKAIEYGIDHRITGMFNLASENCQIHQIADAIRRVVPDCKIEKVDMKFEDLRNYRVSTDKWLAHGWKPRWTIDQGIQQIVDIVRQERIRNPEDPIYSNEQYLRGYKRPF